MLNNYQVEYLAKIAGLKIHWLDNVTPLGVSPVRNDESLLAYPYENFRTGMGLDHIRFHWLLGEKNFIAGGSVLNWIWQENTQDDVDFFFQESESADNFVLFLKSVGMVETKRTGYARTLFDSQSGAVIQAVGAPEDEEGHHPYGAFPIFNTRQRRQHKFAGYGAPHKILNEFDIEVCKFAIDINNVFFTQQSIIDLISLTLNTTENIKDHMAVYRILKYTKKGFYPSTEVMVGLSYEQQFTKF